MSLWLLLFLLHSVESVHHQIVITNLVSVASPDYGNISFTVVDSKMSLFTFNIHRIDRAMVKVELNVQTSENGPFTNFMKRTVDLCEAIANPQYDKMMYIVYKTVVLNKRNHMFNKCPIKSVRNKFTRIKTIYRNNPY